jgi:serine/threonine-protein kinase HipA
MLSEFSNTRWDAFEPQNIHGYQLAEFAETCMIDKKLLSRLLVGLANKGIQQLIAQGSGSILINDLKEQPDITADDIRYFKVLSENIISRTTYLKAQAAEIPSV